MELDRHRQMLRRLTYGQVYFLANAEKIKIGFSTHPAGRVVILAEDADTNVSTILGVWR